MGPRSALGDHRTAPLSGPVRTVAMAGSSGFCDAGQAFPSAQTTRRMRSWPFSNSLRMAETAGSMAAGESLRRESGYRAPRCGVLCARIRWARRPSIRLSGFRGRVCEANGAGFHRGPGDRVAGHLEAGDVPEAEFSAVRDIDVDSGRGGRMLVYGSGFVRSVSHPGCAGPCVFEDQMVVAASD